MKWFKDQIKKQLSDFVVRKAEKATAELAIEGETVELEQPQVKNYRSAKLVNDTLTVVFHDGQVLTKSGATKDDFEAVSGYVTKEEIYKIMSSPEVIKAEEARMIEVKKEQALSRGVELLSTSGDFVVEGGSVYMRDFNDKIIKRSVPQMLVERFAQILDDDSVSNEVYDSLRKFWLKCCLNPNAQSAEDLYTFLKRHQFKIDKHGNFYAYRRVVSKGSANQELVEFISQAYTKIKAVWKKNTADYSVIETTDGYSFCKNDASFGLDVKKVVGNLKGLYIDLPNMQEKSYTSAHTGREDYRIGEVMSMPRQDGDDYNGASCSKGFHAASKAYDYSGFGDTPILMIINPMDVLAVPIGEDGKLRTCRWFFATTLIEGEKYILDDDDFNVAELGNIFEAKCAIDLMEHVERSFAEEVKRHTFTLSKVTKEDIKAIVTSLDDMRAAIAGRVKEAVW